jgi:hypothetical protein
MRRVRQEIRLLAHEKGETCGIEISIRLVGQDIRIRADEKW